MSKKPKKNFMKNIKYNFKKDKSFQTVFNIAISSKALFGLSESALKLYIMFVLNGKKNVPSIKIFSKRMGKSERTISRLYEELKEKGFLKIHCVNPKVYQYTFDYNGNIGYKKPKKEKTTTLEETTKEKIVVLEETKNVEENIFEEVADRLDETNQTYLDKAATIVEYEDFAVLENIYWNLDTNIRSKVLKIVEDRLDKEPNSKEVLTWFIEKVKYA